MITGIKKIFLILLLLKLVVSCATIEKTLPAAASTNNRQIASVNTLSCADLIKQFLSSPHQSAVWHSLKTFSLETRLKFFNRLSKLSKASATFSQKMATLLNQAIEENVLSPAQVEKLIKQLDNTKLRKLLVMQNNRVHHRLNNIAQSGETFDQLFKSLTLQNISDEISQRYLKSFQDLDIHADDLIILNQMFPEGLPSHNVESQTLIDYLHFLHYLGLEEKQTGLNEVNQIFGEYRGQLSTQVSKFLKLKKQSENFYSKQYQKNFDTLKSTYKKDDNTKKMIADAKIMSRQPSQHYKNLLFACTAKMPNHFNSAAGKQFTYLLVGLQSTISAGAFFAFYEDKWDQEAMMRIGWDIGISIVVGSIIGRIQSDYADSILAKWYKSFFLYTTEDSVLYGDMFLNGGIYGLLFGVDQKEAKERVDAILNDPEKNRDLEKLISIIKENKIDEKVAKQMVEISSQKLYEYKKNKESQSPQNDPVLESEFETQKTLLMEAMATQLYNENAGDLIQLGTPGWDRFVYHRYWDVFGISRTVLVSALMLRSICMHHGQDFIHKYAAAMMIYMADNLITQPLYYGLRRKLIHQ